MRLGRAGELRHALGDAAAAGHDAELRQWVLREELRRHIVAAGQRTDERTTG